MKTRFCPSPTGLMHLGNVRTALFNFLISLHEQGVFLLRIEDTDQERSQARFTDIIQQDLLWLGLEWQEGPVVGGKNGPYWQAARQKIYDRYYDTLAEKNLVYPCFCSERHLVIMRKAQLSSGHPPRYDGTCRHLSAQEVQQKYAAGEKAVLRFRIPEESVVEFTDLVKGRQRFDTNALGDFVIRRTDGTAPFMYANALDDALMKITHVIRGEDHLTNTPRQILLLQALGLSVPTYCHISLIVGHDGAPLSKRHGSKNLRELHQEGYLPGALINYLARLGHYYEDNRYMDLEELAKQFHLSRLSSAPAHYDSAHLIYWQREAISRDDEERLWEWMGKPVHELVPKNLRRRFINAIRPNITFPRDALSFAMVLYSDDIVFNNEDAAILAEAGENYFKHAKAACCEYGDNFELFLQSLKERSQNKGKKLFLPLRLALTGRHDGPELPVIFGLMGQNRVCDRFDLLIKERARNNFDN